MNLKDPMDDRMSEELSSFADAEISERDLGRWVARVTGDQEARGRFSRYRLIGAQLAAEDEKIVNASSIADKVSQALLDEPTVLAPRNWRKSIHFLGQHWPPAWQWLRWHWHPNWWEQWIPVG